MKGKANMKIKGRRYTGLLVMGVFLLFSACSGGTEKASGSGAGSASAAKSAKGKKQQRNQRWTCSMHPQVDEAGPGKCPYCGMDLIPVTSGGGGVLTLTPEAAALAELKTEEIKRRPLQAAVTLTGKIVEDETRVHAVTAWVGGRIDRLFVDFTGTRVSVGDHVAELYSPQMISSQEEYLEARKALGEPKGSKSSLMFKTSEASVRAARDKLKLLGLDETQIQEIEKTGKAKDHITIRAPHGGIVTKKKVRLGMYVKTGQELFEVVNLDQVWVELLAFERDLPLLQFGQKVEVRVDALPGKLFEGRISLLDPEIDSRTRTLPLRVVLKNQDLKMRPGMFARASVKVPLDANGHPHTRDFSKAWICPMHPEIVQKEKGNCPKCGMPLVTGASLGLTEKAVSQNPIAVPESAVLYTGRRSVVWVKMAGKKPKYMPKQILLGPRAEGYYVVLAGLMEGERVVTDGAFKLDSEAQIKSRPSAPIPSMMSPQGMESPKGIQKKADSKTREMDILGLPAKDLAKTLDIYLEVQKTMAGSDWESARKKLLKGLAGLTAPVMEKLRRELLGDPGPTHLKRVFQKLGGALFARKGDLAGMKTHLVWAFCPMAFDNEGANWIQIGKAIRNPYFGKSMLTCGEVVEVLQSSKKPQMPTSKPTSKPASKPSTPFIPKKAPGKIPKGIPRGNQKKKQGKVSSKPSPSMTKPKPKVLIPEEILTDYLKIQKALSEDRIQDAAKGLLSLAQRDTLGVLKGVAPGKGSVAVRHSFEVLGKYLLNHKKGLRGKRKGLVVAHCPMAFKGKGADWLQIGKEILNPYFGSSMLHCGSVVEELAPSRSEKGGKK
jgi:Cu(I)/Ag(I) efflux system membrane fusion protein